MIQLVIYNPDCIGMQEIINLADKLKTGGVDFILVLHHDSNAKPLYIEVVQ